MDLKFNFCPNEAIVEFSVRQVLNMLTTSNFAATNPELLQETFRSGGENFVLGMKTAPMEADGRSLADAPGDCVRQ